MATETTTPDPEQRADADVRQGAEEELRSLRERRKPLAHAARYDADARADLDDLDVKIRNLESQIQPTCGECGHPLSPVGDRRICSWRPCTRAARAQVEDDGALAIGSEHP